MKFSKFLLIFVFVSGFLSVAFGAFGAHALKDILTEKGMDNWETAVLYQMFHTAALIGIFSLRNVPKYVAWFFMIGIVLFSGSLFAYSLTGIGFLVVLTPLGGVSFLAGWLGMIIYAVRMK
ncbi:MAG: membrane protein [Ignavibacteriales bacterium]